MAVTQRIAKGEHGLTAFGPLQALRERPLPNLNRAAENKRQYRSIPIDAEGRANQEPLVDADSCGVAGANFYAAKNNPPYYRAIPGAIDKLLLRKGAAVLLEAINARIGSVGLELWLFDGWRPQAVQAYFHDHWFPAELRRRKPHLSEETLLAEVETYWAAPSEGDASPSPHSTGGAVDLTLRWRDGEQLWMGSLFDDASAIAHTDHFEHLADGEKFSFSDEEARANRRLLYWLMVEAGFASNPTEWWHYSYGDQMWAKLTGQPKALYAGAEATDFVAE